MVRMNFLRSASPKRDKLQIITPGSGLCGWLALVAVVILGASPICGQETAGSPPSAARQYKYTTPMPPGVAAPNTVQTRLGVLHFFDGFPDKASVDKLYDNLDFQRAVQGYLLALPVVSQVANRDGILQIGAANVTVPIWEQMVDSRTIELTANNNTPYTWFWVDLHKGPLVIQVPLKVLGLTDDMWYHWVGDLGITGADHGRGANICCCRPATKVRCRMVTSFCGRRRSASGQAGAAFWSTAIPNPAWTWSRSSRKSIRFPRQPTRRS